jgi:hypothetical protein
MGMSTWASAVYGVLLAGAPRETLLTALTAAREQVEEDGGEDALYEDGEPNEALLGHVAPEILTAIRRVLKAPPDTDFFYTGDPDNRLGRDCTPPDEWVLGWGLLAFPAQRVEPGPFADRCEWHTWTEGG